MLEEPHTCIVAHVIGGLQLNELLDAVQSSSPCGKMQASVSITVRGINVSILLPSQELDNGCSPCTTRLCTRMSGSAPVLSRLVSFVTLSQPSVISIAHWWQSKARQIYTAYWCTWDQAHMQMIKPPLWSSSDSDTCKS